MSFSGRRHRGAGASIFSLRGTGRVAVTGATGTFNYDTVISGAASQVGDLVLWGVGADEAIPNPGWANSVGYSGASLQLRKFARIIEAADLSSPPAIMSASGNAVALWTALKMPAGLSIDEHVGGEGGPSSGVPGTVNGNFLAFVGPFVAWSFYFSDPFGGGPMGGAWSGTNATPDGDFEYEHPDGDHGGQLKWKSWNPGVAVAAEILSSKSDNGANNWNSLSYVTFT